MSLKKPTKAEVLKRVEAAKEQLDKIPVVKKVGFLSQLRGFSSFMREQGVVGLAIGVVLGIQVKAVVDQLIASFITPLLGYILPGEGALEHQEFSQTILGKTETFAWGAFVFQVISFVSVAAVVYFTFKGLKLDKLDKKKEG